jgi:hypothetical protein
VGVNNKDAEPVFDAHNKVDASSFVLMIVVNIN